MNVSIPHRYAENPNSGVLDDNQDEFQSLIGMLKTKEEKSEKDSKEEFQSLIGMLKTRHGVRPVLRPGGFNPS